MNTTLSNPSTEIFEEKIPRRAWTGLLLISLTLIIQTLVAGYTVPYTLRHSTLDTLLQGGTNPVFSLLSCLNLIAGMIQLIGYILLVSATQNLSRPTKRKCWLAFILWGVSLLLSIIVNVPLGYAVSLGGSRAMGIAALWVTALSQTLSFSSLAMLLTTFADTFLKWAGTGVAGLQSVVALIIAGVSTAFYRLAELRLLGNTMYIPNPEPNPYQPVLTVLAPVLSGVFALLFLISTIRMRSNLVDERSDRVV